MKLKVLFAITLILLADIVTAFAVEEKNPAWVEISRLPVKLVRNQDPEIPMTSPNYWQLRIAYTHTNNSQDREIVAFLDRQIRFSVIINMNLTNARQNNGYPVSNSAYFINVVDRTANPISPGEQHELGFRFSLGTLINVTSESNWQALNEEIGRIRGSEQERARALFRDGGFEYDFNVRSESSPEKYASG